MTRPLVFRDLLTGGWEAADFEPFRKGVTIHHILRGEPSIALLRYEPGARVPRHRHQGLETILVLEGTQIDDNGVYPAGAMMANPEGSEHSVWSETGCVVLIQWNRPVLILEEEDQG